MTVTAQTSNLWRYQLGKKLVDVSSDTFMAILVYGLTFDPANHITLDDIIASPSYEIAEGNGYTQQNITLTGGSWAQDDVNDRGSRIFDDITVTADGGSIGPFDGIIIYDSTTGSASPYVSPTVVGYISLGGQLTLTDGLTFRLTDPEIRNG